MKTTILVLMLFLASTVTGQTIDLYKLTLNDSILSQLTLDRLTNMLGRPSAIKNWDLIEPGLMGPEIYYHNKGLRLCFFSKNDDPKQRIKSVELYLVKKWDNIYNEFYLPFSGNLLPNVNLNMKTNAIIPFFNNYKVEVESGEERRKQWEKINIQLGTNKLNIELSDPLYDSIVVNNKEANITFFCEELTKFLEKVTIRYR